MKLREAQGFRVCKTRMMVSDLVKEGLEKPGQANRDSRVSLVAREGTVLEIGNGVGESDEGREKGRESDVIAWVNHRGG